MTMKKKCLINFVLPVAGTSISVKAYRDTLKQLGFNKYQIPASIGGGISGGSLVNNNGTLTRK